MGNLENIIYSPLLEESLDELSGWHKDTVNYVINERQKIYRQIRMVARGLRKHALQVADVEDIYGEILMYLYGCSDYDLGRALTRSSTGSIVSIEGYLNTCIKYCIMRYCNQMTDYEEHTIADTIMDDNDKELSIFNAIADPNSSTELDSLDYDLPTLCKSCESLRYKFGVDIYLIYYIRLLTMEYNIPNRFKEILSALDIHKMDLNQFDNSSEDSVMVMLAKAISFLSLKEAISVIEKYVYSAKLIREAIQAF